MLSKAKLMRLCEILKLEADLDASRKKSGEAEAAVKGVEVKLLAESPYAEDVEGAPYGIIVQNINKIESQFNRDDFFRLRDIRENDAEMLLEFYQKQLADCRARPFTACQDKTTPPEP